MQPESIQFGDPSQLPFIYVKPARCSLTRKATPLCSDNPEKTDEVPSIRSLSESYARIAAKRGVLMSLLGQERTSEQVRIMSALCQKRTWVGAAR